MTSDIRENNILFVITAGCDIIKNGSFRTGKLLAKSFTRFLSRKLY